MSKMKKIYFLIPFVIFTIVYRNYADTSTVGPNTKPAASGSETLRTLQTLSYSIPECAFKFVPLHVNGTNKHSVWDEAWEYAEKDAKSRQEALLTYRNVTPRFKKEHAEREELIVNEPIKIKDTGALLNEETGVVIWKKSLAKGRSDDATLKKKDIDFFLKGDIRRAKHRFCMWKMVNKLLEVESSTIQYMPVAIAFNDEVANEWKVYVDLKKRKVAKKILDAQAIKLIDMEIGMVRQNRNSSMATYVTIVGKDGKTILMEISTPYLPLADIEQQTCSIGIPNCAHYPHYIVVETRMHDYRRLFAHSVTNETRQKLFKQYVNSLKQNGIANLESEEAKSTNKTLMQIVDHFSALLQKGLARDR